MHWRDEKAIRYFTEVNENPPGYCRALQKWFPLTLYRAFADYLKSYHLHHHQTIIWIIICSSKLQCTSAFSIYCLNHFTCFVLVRCVSSCATIIGVSKTSTEDGDGSYHIKASFCVFILWCFSHCTNAHTMAGNICWGCNYQGLFPNITKAIGVLVVIGMLNSFWCYNCFLHEITLI